MFSRRKIQTLTAQLEAQQREITRLMDENKRLSEQGEIYKLEIASRKKRDEIQSAELDTLKAEAETLKDRFNAAQFCIELREDYAKYLKMLLDEVAPGLLEARLEAGRPTHTQWQPRRRTPRRPK